MDRDYYLQIAAGGLRTVIGTDLVLHDNPDPEQIVRDGRRLGKVVESAARQYGSPFAIPLMDLRLEKADLAGMLGIAEAQADSFHFEAAPGTGEVERVQKSLDAPFSARGQANIDALAYIAQQTELLPVGMLIGPFSLMTKLMADPITAVALAGMGLSSGEDENVLMAEHCLELAEMAIARSVQAQMRAGAKAVIVCEPAANIVFLSPKQIEAGADVFERFVMQPNLRLKKQLASGGADLIFHDCGDLNDFMVKQFATRLRPAILSLGSSRKLWEDAALVPKDIVLFGNLPTKSFYSDQSMPDEKVEAMTLDLLGRMRIAGHPHILASECDVLHVPQAAASIRRKTRIMLSCSR